MDQRHKRLGEYLQENSGIGSYQVFRALQEQARLRDGGKYRPFGQILMDLGYVSEGQLDEALEIQTQDLVRFHYRGYSQTSAVAGPR